MYKLIYNIFLLLYSIAIRIAGLWNPKAKKWVIGRKHVFAEINTQFSHSGKQVIWMHCASLGEFEQGRPLLELLKQQYPNCCLVLTFFSPSGYEATKNYKGVDFIFYLPMDNIFSAKKFIDSINPSLVLWVKYEYWFYYLQELKLRNIPVLLVSGIFRINQPFFKWYGKLWRGMLNNFNHFFVQNQSSQQLLQSIGISQNVTVSGDTRFDRVIEIAKHPLHSAIIESFCSHQKIIVAGSTWDDDNIILAAYADNTKHREKLIIVPHELDKQHLLNLKKLFKKSLFYTEVENTPELIKILTNYDTLIVDTIGMLSRLYSFGTVNYVGGGFTNDGIHNILEAAVWGKPIVMGENYEKYSEAVDLVECLAAEPISNTNELKEIMNILMNDTTAYDEAGNAAKQYVYNNGGATAKIAAYIYMNRLLTN